MDKADKRAKNSSQNKENMEKQILSWENHEYIFPDKDIEWPEQDDFQPKKQNFQQFTDINPMSRQAEPKASASSTAPQKDSIYTDDNQAAAENTASASDEEITAASRTDSASDCRTDPEQEYTEFETAKQEIAASEKDLASASDSGDFQDDLIPDWINTFDNKAASVETAQDGDAAGEASPEETTASATDAEGVNEQPAPASQDDAMEKPEEEIDIPWKFVDSQPDADTVIPNWINAEDGEEFPVKIPQSAQTGKNTSAATAEDDSQPELDDFLVTADTEKAAEKTHPKAEDSNFAPAPAIITSAEKEKNTAAAGFKPPAFRSSGDDNSGNNANHSNSNNNGNDSDNGQRNKQKNTRRKLNYKRIFILLAILLLPFIIYAAYNYFHRSVQYPHVAETKAINILLLGVDKRSSDGGRSDTMMLLTLDQEKNHLSMVSLPRDTRVEISPGKYEKLNHAYAYGGTKLSQKVVEKLLNIPIDYYVEIDLQAFETFIDDIGGLDIDIEKRMYYEDPYDDNGGLIIDFYPGMQHLNGIEAMEYVRYRDEEGDIGRIQRQQKFINAVMAKITQPDIILKLPKIVSHIVSKIDTDLPTGEILKFIPELPKIKENGLSSYMLPGTPAYIDGVNYWLPNISEDRNIAAEAMGISYDSAKDEATAKFIEQYNRSLPKDKQTLEDGTLIFSSDDADDETADEKTASEESGANGDSSN